MRSRPRTGCSRWWSRRPEGHPRNVFIREDAILPTLDQWLSSVFDPDSLDGTCDALAAASLPHPQLIAKRRELTRRLTECDRQLGRYRKALAGNGDASVIADWIAETQREREQLQPELAVQASTGELTRHEAQALVESVEDLTRVISEPGGQGSALQGTRNRAYVPA